jgi:hypothetical protein
VEDLSLAFTQSVISLVSVTEYHENIDIEIDTSQWAAQSANARERTGMTAFGSHSMASIGQRALLSLIEKARDFLGTGLPLSHLPSFHQADGGGRNIAARLTIIMDPANHCGQISQMMNQSSIRTVYGESHESCDLSMIVQGS